MWHSIAWKGLDVLRLSLVVSASLAVLILPTWMPTASASVGHTSQVTAAGLSSPIARGASVPSASGLHVTSSWPSASRLPFTSPCTWSGQPFGEDSTSPPLTGADCQATFLQETSNQTRRAADVLTLGLGLLLFCGGVLAADRIARR